MYIELLLRCGGERGIRTLDGVFAPYSLSRGAPSAARPPLHILLCDAQQGRHHSPKSYKYLIVCMFKSEPI